MRPSRPLPFLRKYSEDERPSLATCSCVSDPSFSMKYFIDKGHSTLPLPAAGRIQSYSAEEVCLLLPPNFHYSLGLASSRRTKLSQQIALRPSLKYRARIQAYHRRSRARRCVRTCQNHDNDGKVRQYIDIASAPGLPKLSRPSDLAIRCYWSGMGHY